MKQFIVLIGFIALGLAIVTATLAFKTNVTNMKDDAGTQMNKVVSSGAIQVKSGAELADNTVTIGNEVYYL